MPGHSASRLTEGEVGRHSEAHAGRSPATRPAALPPPLPPLDGRGGSAAHGSPVSIPLVNANNGKAGVVKDVFAYS